MRVSTDVVARRVDDSVVLVHLGSDRIYSLNVTGGRFWELLSEGLDSEAIVRHLVAEFDIDGDSARAEMEQLAADLVRHGLVVESVDGG